MGKDYSFAVTIAFLGGFDRFDRPALLMNTTDPTMIADAAKIRGVKGSCANQLPRNTATKGLT